MTKIELRITLKKKGTFRDFLFYCRNPYPSSVDLHPKEQRQEQEQHQKHREKSRSKARLKIGFFLFCFPELAPAHI